MFLIIASKDYKDSWARLTFIKSKALPFLKFLLSLSLRVILLISKLEKILASLSSGLLAVDAEANLS